MTQSQISFVAYCKRLGLKYEFTSETVAYNWWRMASDRKIGEMRYNLQSGTWYPQASNAEKVEVKR